MSDLFVGEAKILSRAAFDAAVATLGSEPEALWALLAVETRGFGYQADRRMKILFERHIFSKRTGGAFDASNPDISAPTAGGYGLSSTQYARLRTAIGLNRTAAIESASWGLPQVMGFNAAGLGYGGAEDMIVKFRDGEDAQLDGAIRFIATNPTLAEAFRKRDWAVVAFHYNGKDFAKNAYDVKLAQHYDLYKVKGVPDIELRAAQGRLIFLGFDPNGADGKDGPGTQAATIAFQKSRGLPVTGQLDPATRKRLIDDAGV